MARQTERRPRLLRPWQRGTRFDENHLNRTSEAQRASPSPAARCCPALRVWRLPARFRSALMRKPIRPRQRPRRKRPIRGRRPRRRRRPGVPGGKESPPPPSTVAKAGRRIRRRQRRPRRNGSTSSSSSAARASSTTGISCHYRADGHRTRRCDCRKASYRRQRALSAKKRDLPSGRRRGMCPGRHQGDDASRKRIHGCPLRKAAIKGATAIKHNNQRQGFLCIAMLRIGSQKARCGGSLPQDTQANDRAVEPGGAPNQTHASTRSA
jgi:hypothetical protein